MTIKRHRVPGAPPPPRGVKYHDATEADGWLYVTGQLPSDPRSPSRALAGRHRSSGGEDV